VEGDRSLEQARQLFHQLEQCRRPESSHPLVASDGWDAFKRALIEIYGRKELLPGLAFAGQRKTHIVLPGDLGYVQVRKIRQGKRVIRVERHIVFGAPLEVLDRLQRSGNGNIHTAYIERFNGTIRGCLARFVRKTLNFSKQLVMHTDSIDIFQAWYNFVRPHQSLRR
jgi:IS1 family transposase